VSHQIAGTNTGTYALLYLAKPVGQVQVRVFSVFVGDVYVQGDSGWRAS
jgi:hypothetical protein